MPNNKQQDDLEQKATNAPYNETLKEAWNRNPRSVILQFLRTAILITILILTIKHVCFSN